MRRFVTGVDRLGTLVLGLLLLAIGVGFLAWAVVDIDNATVLTAPGLVTAAGSAWWPWATAAAGVVLVPLGMRWLLSRGPAERPRPLTLPGSDRTGRLTADLKSLASAAADQLSSHPAVRSAKGSAIIDRGAPSIQLKATASSAETLAEPRLRAAAAKPGIPHWPKRWPNESVREELDARTDPPSTRGGR